MRNACAATYPVCPQALLTSVGYRATMRVMGGIGCLGFVGASTFSGRESVQTRQSDAGHTRDGQSGRGWRQGPLWRSQPIMRVKERGDKRFSHFHNTRVAADCPVTLIQCK